MKLHYFVTDIVFKQSLLGDEDALSLATTMDDNDPDGSLDEFGSGYRGFSAQSSAIRDAKMILQYLSASKLARNFSGF